MKNCLAGCFGDYACDLKPPIEPLSPGHSFAPFVKVRFGSEKGAEITVGNESSEIFNHHAIIKSFSMGASDGMECDIEILDEQGGAFKSVFDHIAKCLSLVSNNTLYIITFRFGWVRIDCNGNRVSTIESPIVKAQITWVEVSYQGGKSKYKLTCNTTAQASMVARESAIYGSDEHKIGIEEAIIKICETNEPKLIPFKGVITKDGSNRVEPFEGSELWVFKNPEEKKDKFECKNQTKIDAITDWIEPFITERKKGIFVTMDTKNPRNIIFWEHDPDPDCKKNNVGTYIVNGGECSPVIDFNPTINWVPAIAGIPSPAGGTDGQSAPASTHKNEVTKAEEPQGKNAGSTAIVPISEHGWNIHSPKKVLEETNTARAAHAAANRVYDSGATHPIRADLVLVGDPRFGDHDGFGTGDELLKQLVGKTLSIVFINPFYIGKKKRDDDDKQYLAQPGCNEILSNKKWQIEGINHTIQEGKFTTTVKILLDAPNIEINKSRLSGDGYSIKEGLCENNNGDLAINFSPGNSGVGNIA
jgi:hypothetical protein